MVKNSVTVNVCKLKLTTNLIINKTSLFFSFLKLIITRHKCKLFTLLNNKNLHFHTLLYPG